MLPRAIRLNNPGNIEKNGIPWEGLASDQPDDRFYKFSAPEYGIRAMCRVLMTYNSKYKIENISQIVTRWAPPHENPTEKYIKNVASWTGFGATEALDFTSAATLAKLAKAITRQEAGAWFYEDNQFLTGAEMAL